MGPLGVSVAACNGPETQGPDGPSACSLNPCRRKGERSRPDDHHPLLIPISTRTAGDPAAACACAVGWIVKSLIFNRKFKERAYLILASRATVPISEEVARDIGETIVRQQAVCARFDRFAAGRTPFLAYPQPTVPYFDSDLLAFETVWAAGHAEHRFCTSSAPIMPGNAARQ